MADMKNLRLALEKEINSANNVIIVPHNGIDFDAIGSALGLALIAKKFKKTCYLIINDPIYKIDSGVQTIIDDVKSEIQIINLDTYLHSKMSKKLFILVDVNKKELTCLNNELLGKKTIIIDHHDETITTVEAVHKYIDSKASSASEIVTKLLCNFKIKPSFEIATYLLAGIYLDTNKFTKHVPPETMRTMAKLSKMGANMDKVTDLFTEDFISDRRIQELVSRAKISTFSVAVVTSEEDIEYTKEELAKVADYLLKYKVDAAFAIGNIGDGIISISARSKEKVNVGVVMQNIEGGGNQYSAATKLSNCTIEEAAKRLMKIIEPPCYIK